MNRSLVLLLAVFVISVSPLCAVFARAQQVAFTWDDLPAHSLLPMGQTRLGIAQKIIEAMHSAGLPPAYGFVNGVRLGEEPASAPVLEAWRRSGNLLGNHTWDHMNLNQHTALEFEADIAKNERLLRKENEGANWHWLRYPYLAEGDSPAKKSEVRAYLQRHGYQIAAVTMSFGDYAWNEPYARCISKGNTEAIRRLKESYLDAASDTILYTRAMSQALYGHDIPYVLLMHVGALDAQMLPRLLKLYKDRGFQFVTLEEAQRDPFYREDMDLALPAGSPSLESAMAERHLPLPAHKPIPDFSSVCR